MTGISPELIYPMSTQTLSGQSADIIAIRFCSTRILLFRET